MFCTIIRGMQRLLYITEEHCHEDPDYRIGRHRDPRNVRGREDPATASSTRPTQQLGDPQQRGEPQPCDPAQFLLSLRPRGDRS